MRLIIHHGDITDTSSLFNIISSVRPNEIYNFAAQSHVAVSFEESEYTKNADALGTLRILEAIRVLKREPLLNLRLFLQFFLTNMHEKSV